ncbi:MAG: hypothetical protein ACI9Y1_000993 [Lentisphaeria bacterium]|jgi:hypothetical protein
MNFKGIKKKLFRFKRIFSAHWPTFVGNNPRYDTHYYHSEVKNCCRVAVRRMGFWRISAWVAVRGSIRRISVAKAKLARSAESVMPGTVWTKLPLNFFRERATDKRC